MAPPRAAGHVASGLRGPGPIELSIKPGTRAQSPLSRPPPLLLLLSPPQPGAGMTHDGRDPQLADLAAGSALPSLPAPTSYEERLQGAIHVLQTEARALTALARLYGSDRHCRDGFFRAIEAITRHRDRDPARRGKVVFTGVGKSGWIARKVAATFTSLGIPAVFLHPTEALHGDLGIVGDDDTILMISFSGRTPELLRLLPHLSRTCALVCLTGGTPADEGGGCDIARARPGTIVVQAPIPESEATTFGVAAPTTSSTAAMAVGDALAYVLSREMNLSVTDVFSRNHPGGAIGQQQQQQM